MTTPTLNLPPAPEGHIWTMRTAFLGTNVALELRGPERPLKRFERLLTFLGFSIDRPRPVVGTSRLLELPLDARNVESAARQMLERLATHRANRLIAEKLTAQINDGGNWDFPINLPTPPADDSGVTR